MRGYFYASFPLGPEGGLTRVLDINYGLRTTFADRITEWEVMLLSPFIVTLPPEVCPDAGETKCGPYTG